MALLISLAALARVVPALLALPQPGWLLIAAGCWSLAFSAWPCCSGSAALRTSTAHVPS